MPQPMTRSTERHQILRPIQSSALSRHDMMNFQEPRPPTTWCPATVPISRQYFPPHAGRYRRCVSATVFTDSSVAAHSFGISPPQLSLPGIGLDGHPSCRSVFVDVNLHRRPPGENPPGGSFGGLAENPPFRKSQLYFLMVCPIDRFSGRPSAFSSSLLEWLGRVFREGLHPRGRTVFQSRGSPQYLPLASITCFSVGFWFSTSTTCQDSVPC